MSKLLLLFWFLLVIAIILRCGAFFLAAPHITDNQSISFVGTIQNQPKIIAGAQKFSIANDLQQFSISTSQNTKYWYGEQLHVSGKVRVINSNGHIFLSVSHPDITVMSSQSQLAKMAAYVRDRVGDVYASVLPDDVASLLVGMVFGVQEQMSPTFLKHLQMAGVMHVIAASGMNITLIAGALSAVFKKFFSRRMSIVLTIAGIFFYTALAGFQSSIVRAAIMGGLGFGAMLTGRQRQSMYVLVLAAAVMLLVRPNWLMDIGFQLSFCATLGILVVKPILGLWVHRMTEKKFFLFDDFFTTFAAHLATLPILVVNFGYYNPLSIIINLFILWTIAPLMLLWGLAAVFSFLFAPVAKLFILLAWPFLWYFQQVVNWFGSIPTVWKISQTPVMLVVGYYLILVGVAFGIKKKT